MLVSAAGHGWTTAACKCKQQTLWFTRRHCKARTQCHFLLLSLCLFLQAQSCSPKLLKPRVSLAAFWVFCGWKCCVCRRERETGFREGVGVRNLRLAANPSRWVLGCGPGWAGRARAGRCCESEGRAACGGRWRRRSGVAERWWQTAAASCSGPGCWTCPLAAGTRWVTVKLKHTKDQRRFMFSSVNHFNWRTIVF